MKNEMKKTMKKAWLKTRALAALLLALAFVFSLCSCGEKKKVVTIYASSEDYRILAAQKMMDEKFPEYDVRIEYKSTGDLAAKLKAEGRKTDCDIVMELENAYLNNISDNLADLSGYVDLSVYDEALVPESHKYVPFYKSSASVIINRKSLEKKGVPVPTCYDDLLKPEYKGLVSMPNPKSSGTGFILYLGLVNAWGEEKALEFFDGLAKNISGAGFTTAGAGPVLALNLGEADIALGMTFQAVTEINEGADYEIMYFAEGAPYTTYSSAVIEGRQEDADVMKVFDYLVKEVTPEDKRLYAPEKIYKDRDYPIKNYPGEIPYCDMTGGDDFAVRDRLLDKWKY